MSRLPLVRITGILFILLVILSNIPYTLLIQTFNYDDILREPVGIVLTQFQGGGISLILTWLGFGLSALLLIPASLLLHRVMHSSLTFRHRLGQNFSPILSIATTMGILSGTLQAIGLMRWVFVIPVLANLYNDPESSTVTRETVAVIYQVVSQYGGVAIGECLGQILLIGWTLGVGLAMRSSSLFKSWIAWWGIFTTLPLFWGQSELLATVIPKMSVWETTPIGFILWEIWLLLVGISLILVPQKHFLLPKQI